MVLITTKSGSATRFAINLNSYYGWQSIAKKEKDLNAQQYHDVINAIIANAVVGSFISLMISYGTKKEE